MLVHTFPADRAWESPNSDYELFNCNNFNICYWSWNYRGCWHQTCPPIVPRKRFLLSTHSNNNPDAMVFDATTPGSLFCYFFSLPHRVNIGQFTRLLPSLEVVAISQAPSPVSNPNSPLPITTMVGPYPTILN